MFPGSSMVERSAVNRNVVGSNPTRGAKSDSSSYSSSLILDWLGIDEFKRVRPLPGITTLNEFDDYV